MPLAAVIADALTTPLTATQRPFSLWVNGSDLTAFADIHDYDLQDPGGNQPATLRVVLTDRTNAVGLGIPRRSRLRWVDNVAGRTLFDGFVKLIEPTPMAAFAKWQITATSIEAVLDGLYIVSASRPAEGTDARIGALMALCDPAAAPLAFGAGGHQAVTTAQDAATFANLTLRAAIEAALAGGASGSVGYYIDPNDWSLHTYLGTSTGQAAPYDISDTPNGSTTIAATLMPQSDASAEIDAVYVRGGSAAGSGTVWTSGVPSSPPLVVAVDHPESRDATMLAAIGAAELASRTGLIRLQAVVTGYDGWAKGQLVHVTNVPLGYAATPFVITGLSVKMRSGTGTRQYTLQLGNGPLRLTSAGAVTQAVSNAKVTGAQLAAGTVLPLSIGGTCTFDSTDSGFVYFTVPDLGNGFTVVEAILNTHFRQFWAPATGTGSTTSNATTPGGVTSGSESAHTHTVPGGSHNHAIANHVHYLGTTGTATGSYLSAVDSYDSSGTSQSGAVYMTASPTGVASYTAASGGGGTTTNATPPQQTSNSTASHSHSVAGSSHSHTVPAGGLAYGMFLETFPASWSVTIALEFYSGGAWSAVATYSGIATLNDLARDISAAISQAGEYRLNLSSAGGQPNGGRLVADVSGLVAIKLL